MGRTRFSGPVYGAKGSLGSVSLASGVISSGASTALVPTARFIVPAYEDWYLTEFGVQCSTCSSNAASFKLKVEQNATNTTAATITSGTSTSINSVTACSITAGEYEGFLAPAGSTVRVVSSGNSAMGITGLHIRGYIREKDSSRSLNA